MSIDNYSTEYVFHLKSLSEFFTDPKPFHAIDEAIDNMKKESTAFPLGYESYHREALAWSELGEKVVGAEI